MPRLQSRSVLGKYRIQRRLAEGAFAKVYQAMDTIEGIPVAIKVPHAHLVNRETMEMFRQEARLHAKLDHPNVLAVKNAEVVDGHFIIVYPLGQCSLADRPIRRISVDKFLDYAEQMLAAVAHAHSHKIIHCDLKPENFILFSDKRIRLCDFSISRMSLRTVRGSGSGTVGYIAPEQAMGRTSFRSDVFSLGLIFYEMLTNKLPEWPFEWPLEGHATLKRKLHSDMLSFLRRALELEPRRRFSDAQQMLAAFQKLKPRMRRHMLKDRRRRATSNGTVTRPDWKQIRYREFLRAHRTSLRLDRSCTRCDGPIAESMVICPWGGEKLSFKAQDTDFPARCPRCRRGRKLDWRFCAWCYGAGFKDVSDRWYEDRRYEGRCENKACKGPLIPFMRYCPWCRTKVRRPWKVREARQKCKGCGWSVFPDFWDHCPWCTRRLKK